MLVIYVRDVDLLRPSGGGLMAPIAFLLLLILCEIAPILILMDYSFMNFMTIFEFDRAATREMPEMQSSIGPMQHLGDKSDLGAAAEPLLP